MPLPFILRWEQLLVVVLAAVQRERCWGTGSAERTVLGHWQCSSSVLTTPVSAFPGCMAPCLFCPPSHFVGYLRPFLRNFFTAYIRQTPRFLSALEAKIFVCFWRLACFALEGNDLDTKSVGDVYIVTLFRT